MDQEIRALTITHVLELMVAGQDKKSACKEAGISYKTFDRFLAKHPDTRSEFVRGQQEELLAKYAEISEANRLAVDRLIRMAQTGVSESGEPLQARDLIALQKQLTAILESLEAQMGITEPPTPTDNQLTDAAEEFLRNLNGPKLRHSKSVISHSVEITFGDEPEPPDIVDGQVRDD